MSKTKEEKRDWKKIAEALGKELYFCANHAKFEGTGMKFDPKTGKTRNAWDDIIDALELWNGQSFIDREKFMIMKTVPRSKQKKAFAELDKERAAKAPAPKGGSDE